MKYSKCRCIKVEERSLSLQPDREMCVASVLDCRLMRWCAALRDTAGRTERLYRSSCTSLLTHLRVANPSAKRKAVQRKEPRGQLWIEKKFLKGNGEDPCTPIEGRTRDSYFRSSDDQPLDLCVLRLVACQWGERLRKISAVRTWRHEGSRKLLETLDFLIPFNMYTLLDDQLRQ